MSVRSTYKIEGLETVADMTPFGEYVIVKPIAEKEKNGILLPETAQEKGQKGTVCRVGKGNKEIKMQVEVGNIILYVKWAGSEISVEGENYLIMKQSDILGKYVGETEIELKPLENRIFIEWESATDFIPGTNLARPEGTSKDRHYTGIVLAKGSEADPDMKVGDRIMFNQFCGPERINHNGKRYAFIWDFDCQTSLPLRKDVFALSH